MMWEMVHRATSWEIDSNNAEQTSPLVALWRRSTSMFTGYLRSPPGRRTDMVDREPRSPSIRTVHSGTVTRCRPMTDRPSASFVRCRIVWYRWTTVAWRHVPSHAVARSPRWPSYRSLMSQSPYVRPPCSAAAAFRRIISSVRGTASRMANQRAAGVRREGEGSVAGACGWCWSGRQRLLAWPGSVRVAIDWSEARSGREVRRRRRWLRDLSLSSAAAACCCCIMLLCDPVSTLASNHCQSVMHSAAVQCVAILNSQTASRSNRLRSLFAAATQAAVVPLVVACRVT